MGGGGGGNSDSNSTGSSNDNNKSGSGSGKNNGGDSDGNDNGNNNWQLFFLPLLRTVGPLEGTIAQVVHSYSMVMTQSLLLSLFVPIGTIIAFDDVNHPNDGIIMIL